MHRVINVNKVKRLLNEFIKSLPKWLGALDVTLVLFDVVTPFYEVIVGGGIELAITFEAIGGRFCLLTPERVLVTEVAIIAKTTSAALKKHTQLFRVRHASEVATTKSGKGVSDIVVLW